jgi:GAF domain-containing protein
MVEDRELYQSIIRAVSATMNLPACIWVLDEQAQALRIAAAVGLRRDYVETAILKLDETSVTGEVFRTGEPLSIPDVTKDPRWKYKEEAKEMDWKSALSIPLKLGDRVIGAISIYTFVERVFTLLERELLGNYASQVELTLQRTRERKTLEKLIQVGQSIEEIVAEEPSLVLERIVTGACEITGANCAVVYPYDPERSEFYDINSVAAHGLRRKLQLADQPRPTDGMAARVKREGEVVVNDIENEQPEMLESTFIAREGIKAFMGVSLKVGEEAVGVIYIDFREPHVFSDEEKNTIRLFAHQASIAIYNTRLYEQARSRAEALTRVSEVSRSLASVQDSPRILEGTLKRIAKSAHQVLDADLVDLYQYIQDEKRFLLPPIMVGKRKHRAIPAKIYDDDVVVRIVREGQPRYFQTPKSDPLLIGEFETPREGALKDRFVVREQVQSAAAIPLRFEDTTVGVMFINYRRPVVFTDELRERAELFGDQAAIAINNARLVQELRGRADEVKLLQRVGAQISSTLKLDEILPLLVEGAMDLTKTKSGVVHILDSTGNKIADSYGYPKKFAHPSPRISKEGYTRFIIDTKDQQVVEDTETDERANPDVKKMGVGSFVGTPLMLAEKRVVGVLYVNDTERRLFTEAERSLLRALADQAAIAVENARLFEETAQRANEIALAHEVGRSLSATRDIKDIPRLLVRETLEAFGAEAGSLALINTETREIEFQFALDHKGTETLDERITGYRMPLDKGIAGAVVQSGKPVISNNVHEDSRWHKEVDSVTGFTTKSILAVPLAYGDQVIGVIEILNKRDRSPFSEQERDVLITLALSAAIAIENARLFDGLERRAAQLAQLQEITTTISAQPPDIDKVLRLVVNKLGDIFQEASCAIRLYDSRTDQFTPHTGTGIFEDSVSRSPRPEGTSRYIVNTRQPRYLERDELLSPSDGGPGVRPEIAQDVEAAAYLPLISDGDIIGILYVSLTQSNQFSQDERQILELFADQAAIAIENARLHSRRLEDMAALQEISQAITTASRAEIIQLIAQKAREVTQAEYIGLWTVAPEGDRLIPGAMYGLEQIEIPELALDEHSINGWVALTGEPYVCFDIENDPHYQKWLEDVQSSVAVPQRIGGRIVGTLAAESSKRSAFSKYQLQLLQSLADQAAIAIENSKLYAELQRRNRQLQALRTIYEKIIAVGIEDVDRLLDLLYEEACEIMDLRNAQVQIAFFDETKDEVSFPLAVEQDDGVLVDVVRWSRREEQYRKPAEDEVVKQFKPRVRGERRGLNEYVINTKEPLLITGDPNKDFEQKAKDQGITVWPTFGRFDRPTHSWLGVPMIVHDRVIGVFSIQSLEVERAFSQDHIELLTTMANQAAVAIENARLYTSQIESERFTYLGHAAEGIAHRINNTIALLPLCVRDIRHHLSTVDASVDSNLEMISRNARYILDLAEELQKPSRPSEAGLFDINLLLEEAVEIVDPEEVKVVTKLDETLPEVQTQKLLTDVFVELITNAVGAMTESDEKCLEIGSRLAEGDRVEVWFTDTGKGIPEEEQEHLFELFYTTAEKVEPAAGIAKGFGLWWIRTFLAWQGGDISFESHSGTGTTFVLRLPVVVH